MSTASMLDNAIATQKQALDSMIGVSDTDSIIAIWLGIALFILISIVLIGKARRAPNVSIMQALSVAVAGILSLVSLIFAIFGLFLVPLAYYMAWNNGERS